MRSLVSSKFELWACDLMSIQNSDSFTLTYYYALTYSLAFHSFIHSFIRSYMLYNNIGLCLAPEFISQTPNYNIYLACNGRRRRRKNTQKCIKSLQCNISRKWLLERKKVTPDTLGYKFHLYRHKHIHARTHTQTQCVHKGNKESQAKTPNDKSIKQ